MPWIEYISSQIDWEGAVKKSGKPLSHAANKMREKFQRSLKLEFGLPNYMINAMLDPAESPPDELPMTTISVDAAKDIVLIVNKHMASNKAWIEVYGDFGAIKARSLK